MLTEIAPWTAGVAIGCLVGTTSHAADTSKMLLAGVFSYLSLLCCIALLWLGNLLGLNSLSTSHYTFWLFLCLLLWLYLARHAYSTQTKHSHQVNIETLTAGVLLALMSVIVATMAATMITAPISAWDVLQGGEWGVPSFSQRAITYIKYPSGEVANLSDYDYRHPPTNFLLLAWGAKSQTVPMGGGAHINWMCLLISLCLIIGGYAKTITNNSAIAYMFAILVLGCPLLSNHALLAGYNEILLTVSIVGATALISLSLTRLNPLLVALALVLLSSALFTKSVGGVYVLMVAIALLFGVLAAGKLIGFLSIAAAGSLFAYSLFLIGFSVDFFGVALSWIPDTQQLQFAGRTHYVTTRPYFLIASNLFWSSFVNSSFSLLPALTIISFTCLIFSKDTRSSYNIVFLTLLLLLGMCFLAGIQITDYGMITAKAETDTLLSRLSLPIYCLGYLLPAHLISYFKKSISSYDGTTQQACQD